MSSGQGAGGSVEVTAVAAARGLGAEAAGLDEATGSTAVAEGAGAVVRAGGEQPTTRTQRMGAARIAEPYFLRAQASRF